tara:strand:- start:213 stop:638 length:426 start_codon:yes stop_codon:yes gene_type:complete
MIKYNLKCQNEHEFESWFSNSGEFDKLNKKKLLECIYCSSKKIKKSIMAPRISGSKTKEEVTFEFINRNLKKEKNNLIKFRKFIEKNFEFVGKDFAKKVREVYYDKKRNKAIYGNATPDEREELAEEGIDLLSIPWLRKDN